MGDDDVFGVSAIQKDPQGPGLGAVVLLVRLADRTLPASDPGVDKPRLAHGNRPRVGACLLQHAEGLVTHRARQLDAPLA